MNIRFLSRNQFKLEEATAILGPLGFEVLQLLSAIEELQTVDTVKLVKDKALKAFEQIGHPVFVEQTGLYLEKLNGFPGGLTQIFWDTLGRNVFTEIFGSPGNNKVTAKTIIGYVDGQKFWTFTGEIPGNVASVPAGPQDFQWDCVFIPDGYDKTFAELGSKVKNTISMRRIALSNFAKFLQEVHPDVHR